MATENCKGGLWFTSMGRIVLDDHGYETFSEPGDKKLFTAEELSKGMKLKEFQGRIIDVILGLNEGGNK